MFKKPTRRQFLIRRISLSIIAVLSVIIIAATATLFMMGYRLDSGNRRLEQGALLQFDSKPNNAYVVVDNLLLGGRTATKHTVVAGRHDIKMTKDDYQDWSRTINLLAGTLTWLDYIRFVPIERTVETVTTHQNMAGAKISPDKKWALLQESVSIPQFQLVDLRSSTVKLSVLDLPMSVYSDSETPDVVHSFSIESWDSGGRYTLLKHAYSDTTEWIVLDTQNLANTVNVTRVFGTGFKGLEFASTNGKVLYGLTNDGTIRRVDLSAETLSRALVTHAESFSVFDNTILSFIGTSVTDASKRVAGVYRDGDEAPHILRTAKSNEAALKIALGRYYTSNFVAIAEENVVTVLSGSYPSSSAQDNSSLAVFANFELPGAVSSLSLSPEGDYILAQSGANFVSYEVEHKRIATGSFAVPEAQPASTLRWLDDAYLWNDDGGSLNMRDFDNSNRYSIMTVEPGFDASLSQNGRFFYGIGRDENGYHLQRVKMILD